jgi:hypothetical protein
MLATKPASTGAGIGAKPPYNLAAATAAMMWTCAFATARVTVASTARGLELWSYMLRAPRVLRTPTEPLDQGAGPPPAATTATLLAPGSSPAGPSAPAVPVPFASYRSSGGHAAAQVVVSD